MRAAAAVVVLARGLVVVVARTPREIKSGAVSVEPTREGSK